MKRRLLPIAALLLLASAPSQAQHSGPAAAYYGEVDAGIYRISVGDRPVAYELFALTIHVDSLFVNSEYRQALRGGDTLRKSQLLVVRHFDNDLLFYRSVLRFPGRPTVTRGITAGDTVLTLYREAEHGGQGNTVLKPGGRVFAIESNAYAMFDLLFRELATRRGWQERPVNLLMLGDADTLLAATAKSLGSQAVRWGGSTVEARKYSIGDGPVVFYGWIGPGGYLLRLEQPAMGLIVEREPPRAARSAKKPAAKSASPSKPAAKPAPRPATPSGR